MLKKRGYVIATIVIYALLLWLQIMLDEQQLDSCSWDKPCFRFCCEDKTKCNESIIREEFNTSEPILEMYKNNVTHYEVLVGKPDCGLKKLDYEEPWMFYHVRSIFCLCKHLISFIS